MDVVMQFSCPKTGGPKCIFGLDTNNNIAQFDRLYAVRSKSGAHTITSNVEHTQQTHIVIVMLYT